MNINLELSVIGKKTKHSLQWEKQQKKINKRIRHFITTGCKSEPRSNVFNRGKIKAFHKTTLDSGISKNTTGGKCFFKFFSEHFVKRIENKYRNTRHKRVHRESYEKSRKYI